MTRLRLGPAGRPPRHSSQLASPDCPSSVVPGTGGMTPEELYAYRVRTTAALVLSLIEKGVLQPDEGAKQEAEPP